MNDEQTKPETRKPTGAIAARASIWSLKNHERLIAGLRKYMWAGSATVLVLVLAGKIELTVALDLLGFGGLGVIILLTGLVLLRRSVLYGIEDPDLKEAAHQAMIGLIQSKASKGKKISSASAAGKEAARPPENHGCCSHGSPGHSRTC